MNRHMPRLLALMVALGIPGKAVGQPARVKLLYFRGADADGCPDEQAVRDAVVLRLGYDPFDPAAATVLLARVEPLGHGLLARIEMQDRGGRANGERVLKSQKVDCAELARAMVFAISVAIRPLGVARPPPVEPPRAEVGVSVEAGTPRARTEYGVAGGAHAAVGSAPDAKAGVAAGVSARRGAASLGFHGRYDLPSAEELPSGRIRSFLLVGTVVPCWHRRALALCGVLAGGAFHAAGEDLLDARSVTTPFFAVGPRLAWELPIDGGFSLLAQADALGSLWRTRLRVGHDPAWTTPPLSAAFGLGVRRRLP